MSRKEVCSPFSASGPDALLKQAVELLFLA
jgi:hypothetical protein